VCRIGGACTPPRVATRPQRSMHAATSRPWLGNPHISIAFIELVSAPQRGYEFVATSRLTRSRTHTVLDRWERGGAASPQ